MIYKNLHILTECLLKTCSGKPVLKDLVYQVYINVIIIFWCVLHKKKENV